MLFGGMRNFPRPHQIELSDVNKTYVDIGSWQKLELVVTTGTKIVCSKSLEDAL